MNKFNSTASNLHLNYLQSEGLGRSLATAALLGLGSLDTSGKTTSKTPTKVYSQNEINQRKAEDMMTVTKTLWAEARGEGERGIRAVATVIWNRAGGNPSNLSRVCLKTKQFSCWNSGNIVIPSSEFHSAAYQTCLKVAKEMITGKFTPTVFPNTKNPTHYVTGNLYNSPTQAKWIRRHKAAKRPIDVVGHHVFMRV